MSTSKYIQIKIKDYVTKCMQHGSTPIITELSNAYGSTAPMFNYLFDTKFNTIVFNMERLYKAAHPRANIRTVENIYIDAVKTIEDLSKMFPDNWSYTSLSDPEYGTDFIFVCDKFIIAKFETARTCVELTCDKDFQQMSDIMKCIKFKIKRSDSKKTASFVSVDNQGYYLDYPAPVRNPNIVVKENYNDDIPHDDIVEFLEGDKSGIIILHGQPGTGKTSYIRHLIYTIDKNFIIMDKNTISNITSTNFIRYLIDHKNSVIIMEDCESAISERTSYNSIISTLLNLSDGILGDNLGFKFLCTFNAPIDKIDPAIMRKGRMRIKYEFMKLNKDKCNALAKKIGIDETFDSDTPICDVFNAKYDNRAKKKNVIGF